MPILDASMLSTSEADSPTKDSQENQRKHCHLDTSKQVLQLKSIEQHNASLPGTCETIIGSEKMNSNTKKPTEMFDDDSQQREDLVNHEPDVVPTNATPTTSLKAQSNALQHQVSVVHHEMDIVPTDITIITPTETTAGDVQQRKLLVHHRLDVASTNVTPTTSAEAHSDDLRHQVSMVHHETDIVPTDVTSASQVKTGKSQDLLEIEDSVMLIIQGSDWSLFKEAIANHCPDSGKLRGRFVGGMDENHGFNGADSCIKCQDNLDREMVKNYRSDCNNNITYPSNKERDPAKDFMKASYEREHKSFEVMSKNKVGYFDNPFNSFLKKRPARGRSLKPVSSLSKREQDTTVPFSDPFLMSADAGGQRLHRTTRGGKRHVSRRSTDRKRLRWTKPKKRKADLRVERHWHHEQRNNLQPVHNSDDAGFEALSSEQVKRSVERRIRLRLKQGNSLTSRKLEIPSVGSVAKDRAIKDIESSVQGSGTNETKKQNLSYKELQSKVCRPRSKSPEDIESGLEQIQEKTGKMSTKARHGVTSPTNEIGQENMLCDCVPPWGNDCDKSDALRAADADSQQDLGLRQNSVKVVTESFAKPSKTRDTGVRSPANEKDQGNMLYDCVSPCSNDCNKSHALRTANSDSHQDLGLRHNFVKAVTESFAKLSTPGGTRKQSRSLSKDAKSEQNLSKEVGQTEAISFIKESIMSESFIVTSQESFLELEARTDVPPLKESDLVCTEKFDADGTCTEKVGLLFKREKYLPSKDTLVGKEHSPFSEGERGKQLHEDNPLGTETLAEVNLNNVKKDPWSAGQAAFPETHLPEVASDPPEATSDLPEAASNLREAVTDRLEAISNIPEAATDLPEAASGLPETFEMIETFEETRDDQFLPSKQISVYYKASSAKKEKSTKKKKPRKKLCKNDLSSLPDHSDMRGKVPKEKKKVKLEYGRANNGFHRSLFTPERQRTQNQGCQIAKLTDIQLAVQTLLTSRQGGMQNQVECTSSRVEISQTFVENTPTKVAESQEKVVLEEDENITSYAAVSMSQEDEQELLHQPFSISGCHGTQNQDSDTIAFRKSPVYRSHIFIENSPTKVAASPEKVSREEDENVTGNSINFLSHDKKHKVPHQLSSTSKHQGIQKKDIEVADSTDSHVKTLQLSVENSPIKVAESGEGFSQEEAGNVTEHSLKFFSCERESDCTQKNLIPETPANVDACKGNKHGFVQSENIQLNRGVDDIKELGTHSAIIKSTVIRPNVAISCSEEAGVDFHKLSSHVEFSTRGEDQKNLSEQEPNSDSRSKDGMKSRAPGLSFNGTKHALAEVNKGNCRVTTAASDFWQPQRDASSANKFSLDSQSKGSTVSSSRKIDQQRNLVTLETISMSPDDIVVDLTLKNASDSQTSATFSEVIKDRSNPVALSQNNTYDVMADKFNQLCNALVSDNLPNRKSQEHYMAPKETEQCKDVAIERVATKSPEGWDQLKEHSNIEIDNGENMEDPVSNPTANESDCLESFTDVHYPYASPPQLQRNVENSPVFLDKIRTSKILDLARAKDVHIPTISQQTKHTKVSNAQTPCHQQLSRTASSKVASGGTISSTRTLVVTPPLQVMPRCLSSSVSSEEAAHSDFDSPVRSYRSPYLLRSQSDINQINPASGSPGHSFQEQGKKVPLLRPSHDKVGAQLVAQPFLVNTGPQQAGKSRLPRLGPWQSRSRLDTRAAPLGPWQLASWLQTRPPPISPQRSGSELDIRPPLMGPQQCGNWLDSYPAPLHPQQPGSQLDTRPSPLLYNTTDVRCNKQYLSQRPGRNYNRSSHQRQTNPVQHILLGNYNQVEIKRGQEPCRAFIPPRKDHRNTRRFAFHPWYPEAVEAWKSTHPLADTQHFHPFQNLTEERQRHDTDAVRVESMQGDSMQYLPGEGPHRFNCHKDQPVDNARCPKMTTVRAKRKRSEDNSSSKSKRTSLKLQNSGDSAKRSSVDKRHSCEPPSDIQLIRFKLPMESKDNDSQRAFKCTGLNSCSKQSTVKMPVSQSPIQVKRAISDIGIRQSLKRNIREIKHPMDRIHREHNYAMLDSSKVPKDFVGKKLGNSKIQKDTVGEALDDPKKQKDSVLEILGDPKEPKDSAGETPGDPKNLKDSVQETHGDPKTRKDSIGDRLGDPKEPKDSAGDKLGDPKKPRDPMGETFGDPKKLRDSAGEMMQTVQENSMFVEETQALVMSELSFVKLSSDIVTKGQTASLTKGQSSLMVEGHIGFSAEDQRPSSDEGQTAFSTECQSSVVKNLKERRMESETDMKSSFLNQNEVIAALSYLNEDFDARNDSASTPNTLPGGFNRTIMNNTIVSYTTPKNITLKQFDSLPGRFSLMDAQQDSNSDSNVDSDSNLKADFKTAISSNEVLAKIRKPGTMECFKMDFGSQACDGSAYQENSTKVSRCDSEIRHKDSHELSRDSLIEAAVKQDRFELNLSDINNTVPVALEQKQSDLCMNMKTESSNRVTKHTQETELVKEPDTLESSLNHLKITKSVASSGHSKDTSFLDTSREDCSLATKEIVAQERQPSKTPDELPKEAEFVAQGHKEDPGCLETTREDCSKATENIGTQEMQLDKAPDNTEVSMIHSERAEFAAPRHNLDSSCKTTEGCSKAVKDFSTQERQPVERPDNLQLSTACSERKEFAAQSHEVDSPCLTSKEYSKVAETVSTQGVQPASTILASMTESTALARNAQPTTNKSTRIVQLTARYKGRSRSLGSDETASTTPGQKGSKGKRSAKERRASYLTENRKQTLSANQRSKIDGTRQNPIYIEQDSGTNSMSCKNFAPSASAVPVINELSQTLSRTKESLLTKKRPRADEAQQNPINIEQRRDTKAKAIVSSAGTDSVPTSNDAPILSKKSKTPTKAGPSLSSKKRPRMYETEQCPIYIEQESETNSFTSDTETNSEPISSALPLISKRSQAPPKISESLYAKKRPRVVGTKCSSIDTEQQIGTKSNIWVSTSEKKSMPSTGAVPVISELSQQPAERMKSLSAKKRSRLDDAEQNPVDIEQQNGTRAILYGPSAAAISVPSTGSVPVISEQFEAPLQTGKSLSAKNRPRVHGTEQNPVDIERQSGTRTKLYGLSAAVKSVPSTGAVPVISELSQQPAERRKSLSVQKRSRLDDKEQSSADAEQQSVSITTSAEAKSVANTTTVAGICEQSQQSLKSRGSLLFGVPIDRLNDELNRHRIMNDRFKIELSCCFDFDNGSVLTKWYWKVRPDKKIESRTTQTDINDICSMDTTDKFLKSRLIENSKSYFSRQIQTNKAPILCQTDTHDLSLPLKEIDRSCPTCRSKTVTSCSTQADINDRSYPACRDKACQVDSNMDDESRSTCIDKPSWPCPMEINDKYKSDPTRRDRACAMDSNMNDESRSTCIDKPSWPCPMEINDKYKSDPTRRDRACAMDSNMDDEYHTSCTEKHLCACTAKVNENSCLDSFTNTLRTCSMQAESTLCETGTVKETNTTGNHSKCWLAQSGDFSLCHNCVFSKG